MRGPVGQFGLERVHHHPGLEVVHPDVVVLVVAERLERGDGGALGILGTRLALARLRGEVLDDAVGDLDRLAGRVLLLGIERLAVSVEDPAEHGQEAEHREGDNRDEAYGDGL